ncbi:hypothetical protein INT45_008131 [Circinella minor]|uniref:ISXO2-like transposase domain-containing protein n=1 Tax=Circinella minor TaxID=1195481 RepID=A0A8H7RQW9_9FUNG|nr:hypothetical protein INT45_008131 [Circinella minor]
MSFPTIIEFASQISTHEGAVMFLVNHNVFSDPMLCNRNSTQMHITWPQSKTYPRWRCTNSCCGRSTKSVTQGSYFYNRKANLRKILWSIYGFIAQNTSFSLTRQVGLERRTIAQIIHDIYQVMDNDITDEDLLLGGPDVDEVQIDESKFGKNKHHRGHPVLGVWVFEAGKAFLCIVPNRTADTLIPLIQNHVVPGTKIVSDCHAPYMRLRSLGYDHYAVNHSMGFATVNYSQGHNNGNTLYNSNMIEGFWTAVKRSVDRRHRTVDACPWKLLEFLWRRKHYNQHWQGLLQGLQDTEFDINSSINNSTIIEEITNHLPTRAPGDYSRYQNQEDFSFIDLVDHIGDGLLDHIDSDSSSFSSESESESDSNNSEYLPARTRRRIQ